MPMLLSTEILRKHRERTLQDMWNGKSYDELVAALGQPSMVMEIPGRAHRSTARVYGILDGDSQCIDAYTVVLQGDTLVVAGYFCR